MPLYANLGRFRPFPRNRQIELSGYRKSERGIGKSGYSRPLTLYRMAEQKGGTRSEQEGGKVRGGERKKETPTGSRHNTKNTTATKNTQNTKNIKNTKNTTAARMPPKGTNGRGGISNPPCMADAKEEMPKEKQREKKRQDL